MENDNFIMIPKSVYQSDLNSTEKNVYGFIYSMSLQKGYCYAKNEFIQNELKISKPTLNRVLKSLISHNFIQKKMKGRIRHLIPLHHITDVSKMTLKSIKSDNKNSIKLDTHNNIDLNNKKDKSIHQFSFNKEFEKEVSELLVKLLEYMNKQYLKCTDYKIEEYERKHNKFLVKFFFDYLEEENYKIAIKSNDKLIIFLHSFYLDLKSKTYKKNKRYYPYRFKGHIIDDFFYNSSKNKDKACLDFKNKLLENDQVDLYKNSVANWINNV